MTLSESEYFCDGKVARWRILEWAEKAIGYGQTKLVDWPVTS